MRIQKMPSVGGPANICLSYLRISMGVGGRRTDVPREAIEPEGRGGPVTLFLRKPIATCVFPESGGGGGVRTPCPSSRSTLDLPVFGASPPVELTTSRCIPLWTDKTFIV